MLSYDVHRNGPVFAPPYDSKIEEEFAYHVVKYLDRAVEFVPQAEMRTPWGLFRPDFLVALRGHRVAVELDGKDHHDRYRDDWRDAMLLGESKIDVIYRFEGRSIYRRVIDCVYIMSVLDPELFDERGHVNLNTLAGHPPDWAAQWADDRRASRRDGRTIHLLAPDDRRRTALSFRSKEPDFIKTYYDYAKERGPMPLDHLIALWRNEADAAKAWPADDVDPF